MTGFSEQIPQVPADEILPVNQESVPIVAAATLPVALQGTDTPADGRPNPTTNTPVTSYIQIWDAINVRWARLLGFANGVLRVAAEPKIFTFTDLGALSVGNASTVIVTNAGAINTRRVQIIIPNWLPTNAVQLLGVHINAEGGAATVANTYYPPGVYSFDTALAINAIRPAAATANIQVWGKSGVPT